MREEQMDREVEEQIGTLSEEEREAVFKSTKASNESNHDPIAELLTPLDDLTKDAPLTTIEASLRSLASTLDGADSLRRATVREAAIKKLNEIGVNSPARLIDAALQDGQSGTTDQQQGRPVLFDDPEPWPEPVVGSALLDEIVTILKRFVVLPPNAVEAVALWIVHTHALRAFSISPILAITSPTKRSGKTVLLEVISCLLARQLSASNITPATLFRCVDKYTPSLLIDEADTFLNDNDELRGILNAGHRRSSAFIMRTVGDEHEPVFFVTWCAKAIALIGRLPGTLEDRSIGVPMKRKGVGERVERFNADKAKLELTPFKRKIMRWVTDNIDVLRKLDPEAPIDLNDRAADNWRPLLAVADLIGGQWPKRARTAAKGLSGLIDEGENSATIQLLSDLRDLFEEGETDKLPSDDICNSLASMEDRPWPEWKRGKPITPRQLAKLLAPFGVAPKTIRIESYTAKGYTLEQLTDPFSRYLPPSNRNTVTNDTKQILTSHSDPSQGEHVTDEKAGLSTGNTKNVTDVTDQNPLIAEDGGGQATSTEKPDQEREIMPISILAEDGGKERLCCRFCEGKHFWQSISSVINCANCSPPVSPILVGKWIET